MLKKIGIFFVVIFGQTLFGSNICESTVVEQMHESIESLNENKNFAFVNLGIPDEDLQLMSQFKVKFSREYSRFGDLELLENELSDFLRIGGENDEELIQKITKLIIKTTYQVKNVAGKETAWICVRLSTPNHHYDMPRWHHDGYYYSPYSGFVFKFAMVLKGNSTLFCQLSKELRDILELNHNNREFLSHLLEDSKIETPKPGEGSFFIVGDQNSAAIHSEPKIDGERLFFSVLPGNESEIKELYEKWFPR